MGGLGPDPSSQALRVIRIIRSYPQSMTIAQRKELQEQFKQRYASIPVPYVGKMTDPTWKFEGTELWLMGPTNYGVKIDALNRLLKYLHPRQRIALLKRYYSIDIPDV